MSSTLRREGNQFSCLNIFSPKGLVVVVLSVFVVVYINFPTFIRAGLHFASFSTLNSFRPRPQPQNKTRPAENSIPSCLKDDDIESYGAPVLDWCVDALTSAVHEVIQDSQNPKDCGTRRILLCRCGRICGLGCTLHCLGLCLYLSLGTNRTMVSEIDFEAGTVSKRIPFNGKCTDAVHATNINSLREIREISSAPERVIAIGQAEALAAGSDFKPGSVPDALLPLLRRLNVTYPGVWWAGQVMSYVARPSSDFRRQLAAVKRALNFTHPVAGMHVRRTDKSSDTQFRSLDEYMDPVIKWFDSYETKHDENITERKVFVATDDRIVIAQLKRRYASYQFIHQEWGHLRTKFWTNQLSDQTGVADILTDIFLLHSTDFLVCTFSSNIGRLLYELRQTSHLTLGSAENAIVNLDKDYFYPGGLITGPQRKEADRDSLLSTSYLGLSSLQELAHQFR